MNVRGQSGCVGSRRAKNGERKFAALMLCVLLMLSSLTFLEIGTSEENVKASPKIEMSYSSHLTSTPEGTFKITQNGRTYLARHITEDDVERMKSVAGVKEADKDYNIIVDGHGTGLAPPTEDSWDSMVGQIEIYDVMGSNPPVPSAVDLSQEPYFPIVGNQQSQGSCAAWATTYYMYGYLEARDNDWTGAWTGNQEHLLSPAWTYNKANRGADWGSWQYDNARISRDWGTATLSTMPYDQYDCISWGDEAAWREAPLHRGEEAYMIDYTGDATVDTVKNLLTGATPVTFCLDASQYNPGFADGNYIISSAEYDSSTLSHANTIVGYDDTVSDDGDVGAFRVVNSWGSLWGDAGYYWLTYEAFKEIGSYGNLFLTYIEDKIDYVPDTLATWEFSTSPTRDAYIELGIGDYTTPAATKTPFYVHDQNNNVFPAFMCIDISEFRSIYDSGTTDFYLYMGTTITGGTISSFRIERYDDEYTAGSPEYVSAESPDVPRLNPCYVTVGAPFVHNLDKDTYHTTITKAVDNASAGNTIRVPSGTYYENVLANMPLTLMGEGYDTTVIQGNGSQDAVRITADWVNITGFTITGSGSAWGDAGIEINNAQNCRIADNNVSSNDIGIYLEGASNSILQNNIAFSNTWEGIYALTSNDNTIVNNSVTSNGWDGICLETSNDNIIKNNTISSNAGNGVYLYSSSNNLIYHNNFISNPTHAYDDGVNFWNSSYTLGGNYWDDWTSPDSDLDGYVDNPRLVDGGSNQDNWPFSNLNGWSRVYNMDIGEGFRSIQAAIDHPQTLDGHTLVAASEGTYYENVEIYKSITLIKGCEEDAIINGSGSGDVVNITADWVNITGFTVTWSGGDPGDAGIELYNAQNCEVYENNVSLNQIGVNLSSSDSNYIYHNNFLDNAVQANDEGTNSWDNGYPDGGNYWSDWTSPDGDLDGFVDNPRSIDGGTNQDNWPFSIVNGWFPVRNIDTMECFESINVAISDPDTLDGHTLTVSAGTYDENLLVDKSITLIGESSVNTIINGGGGSGDVVNITADWVNITAFTITGSGIAIEDSGIELDYVQNCKISDCNVSNNGNGINFESSDGSSIINTTASFNTFDGIVLDGSGYNTLSENTVTSNGGLGIYIYNSDYNTVDNSTVSSNSGHGIHVYSYSDHVTLSDNTANSNGQCGICYEYFSDSGSVLNNTANWNSLYGIQVYNSGFLTILDNNVSNNDYGLHVSSSSGTDILNNTVSGNSKDGIYIAFSNGATIAGNTVISNTVSGIYEKSMSSSILRANKVADNGYGLSLYSSNYNNILGNNVSDNDHGVILDTSSSNSIKGNKISNSTVKNIDGSLFSSETGLEVYQNDNNTVGYADIWDLLANGDGGNPLFTRPVTVSRAISLDVHIWGDANALDLDLGIFLDGKGGNPVDGVTQAGEGVVYNADANSDEQVFLSYPEDGTYLIRVFGHDLATDPAYFDMDIQKVEPASTGIFSMSSSDNEVWNCTISDNQNGINLTFSSDLNEIYHNNILGNTVQAWDDGTNTWDKGYPDGGNHWSDWTTPDSDGDGFVDNPRVVEGGSSQDNWPFADMNGWIPVHNIDTDERFETIQTAIDDTDTLDGHTIKVRTGTYYENVVIDKSITLIGESKYNTIINGGGSGDVVYVTADWVNITAFSITGSGTSWGNAGIELNNVQNCGVDGNNVSNNDMGIYLEGSTGNTIRNNIANWNTDCGIYLYQSTSNEVRYNTASSNLWAGMFTEISANNDICNNTISYNADGLYLFDTSNDNVIANNTFSSNTNYGVYADTSDNNLIYNNNFISNANQALDNTGTNFWNATYPTGGNYWSDYTGIDTQSGPLQDQPGSDGIGDTPYSGIDGGTGAQDNYPLMAPINPVHDIPIHLGWNLVSMPLIQSSTALADVLSDIADQYDLVQWYNASDTADPWKTWSADKPSHMNDLTDIDHTMGIWINITDTGDGYLRVYGDIPASTNIPLKTGWNHVGYPTLTTGVTVGSAFSGLGVNYKVKGYDGASADRLRGLSDSDIMTPGEGYWVWVDADCIWTVDW